MRTVWIVLFLQILTLLSVKHCLPLAGHVEIVFSESVFSAAVHYSNCSLHYTTSNKEVLCPTLATTVPRYTRLDLLSLDTVATPLPLPPADRTSVTSRYCQKRAEKATPIEKRGKE